MKRLQWFIACLLLISTNVLLANVMLPSFFDLIKWDPGSFLATLLGFFLEYMCICILIRARNLVNFGEAFFCTLFMNFISSLLGIIFKLLLIVLSFSIIKWAPRFDAYIIENINASDILTGIAMLLSYTIINTLIEVWIPLIWFSPISTKRTWFWVFIANLLSNGVGILWLGAHKYAYGAFA